LQHIPSMMDLSAKALTPSSELESIIRILNLTPLEPEGGFFNRTFISSHEQSFWMGSRSTLSAIYYLVTPDSFSLLHRLQSDEIYHFYLGDPLELHEVDSEGRSRLHLLGTDLRAGERPQAVIPAGSWQCSRSRSRKSGYSLVGTTVAPAFDFRDFELLSRAEFSRWPVDMQETLRGFIK
jgi:predicted cupin superfamily sugar epimerase